MVEKATNLKSLEEIIKMPSTAITSGRDVPIHTSFSINLTMRTGIYSILDIKEFVENDEGVYLETDTYPNNDDLIVVKIYSAREEKLKKYIDAIKEYGHH